MVGAPQGGDASGVCHEVDREVSSWLWASFTMVDRAHALALLGVVGAALGARSQLDIAIGYQATKYIGVPLIEKSQTANYRASWGAKANCTSYSASDVVMVTGNRSSNQLGQELLKQHFEREYKPLLDAAVKAGAKILCGNDGDTDALTRQYLTELGSDLHLNSAGYYEATNPASVAVVAPASPVGP